MNSDPNYIEHLNQGRLTQKENWKKIYSKYLEDPKLCVECNQPIPYKKRKVAKFCSSSCAAKYNNKKRTKPMVCPSCNKEFKPERNRRKYCSQHCSSINAGKKTSKSTLDKATDKLKKGIKVGHRTLKRIVLERDGNKCSICSMPAEWEFKPVVLILDHIDGNSENNDLENLRLVCPNCDSQLPTYKGRNTGNGRYSRRQRYKEGKSY